MDTSKFSVRLLSGVSGLLAWWVGMASSGSACAQSCDPHWIKGLGIPGTVGVPVAATLWDPDGAGPARAGVAMFGPLSVAGDRVVNGAARFDGTSWEEVPSGLPSSFVLHGVVGLGNGSLVAYGLPSGNSAAFDDVYLWSGGGWTKLPLLPFYAGFTGGGVLRSGEFFLSGQVFNGTTPLGVIAWTGSGWHTLGQGVRGGVRSSDVSPDGALVVGGDFTQADGKTVDRVATWDGTGWMPVGNGIPEGIPNLVRWGPGGQIVAYIENKPIAHPPIGDRFRRWDGQSWVVFGGLPAFSVKDMCVLGDGSVVVCAQIADDSGRSVLRLFKWEGDAWVGLGGSLQRFVFPGSSFTTMTKLPDDSIVITGQFESAEGTAVQNVAVWNGKAWSAPNRGTDGEITSSLELPGGELVLGGSFRTIEGEPIAHIALWDGRSMSPIGNGFEFPAGYRGEVSSMVLDGEGSLIVATRYGTLNQASLPSLRVWRLEGGGWQPLGPQFVSPTPVSRPVLTLAPDGRVALGSTDLRFSPEEKGSGLVIWDGNSWSREVDIPNVRSFQQLPDGVVLVGRTDAWGEGGNLFEWSSTGVRALLPPWYGFTTKAAWRGPDETTFFGDGGEADSASLRASRVYALQNGRVTQLGRNFNDATSGAIRAFQVTPANELIAAGEFSRYEPSVGVSVPANGIAVFRNGDWQPFDATFTGPVASMTRLSSKELLVGGGRAIADGRVVAAFCRWTDTGEPWVVKQPRNQRISLNAGVTLEAILASGYGQVSYQWQRADGTGGWLDLIDGPGGAGAGGGVVAGSAGIIDTNGLDEPAVLTISGAQYADSATYRLRVSNSCGARESRTVLVTVACAAADVNGDGQIDTGDWVAFFGCWDVGGTCADLTLDGVLNLDDFFLFLQSFDSGC